MSWLCTMRRHMGQAASRAQWRISCFRDDYCCRAVKGTMLALAQEEGQKETLPARVLFGYLDGKVHGNTSRFLKAFTGSDGKVLPKEVKHWYMTTSPDAAADAKDRVAGGAGSMQCVELCLLVGLKNCSIPLKPCLYQNGDNRCDLLGPFDKVLKYTHKTLYIVNCVSALSIFPE